jgi:hypothetical protein
MDWILEKLLLANLKGSYVIKKIKINLPSFFSFNYLLALKLQWLIFVDWLAGDKKNHVKSLWFDKAIPVIFKPL